MAFNPVASPQEISLPNSRETPAVDETKIIAAILCARTLLPEDVASDPVGKIVDLYERIASADPRPRSEAAEAGAVRVRVKVAGGAPPKDQAGPDRIGDGRENDREDLGERALQRRPLNSREETDSLAEGEGFEPSVPRKRDRTSGANVRSSERESAPKHKSDGIRLPILSTHLH